MPSGTARSCFQYIWLFCQSESCRRSLSDVVLWTPAHGWAKVVRPLWKLLGWKVFCPRGQFCVQQCGSEIEQAGTLFFSAYSALCVSWFGRRNRKNSPRTSLSPLRPKLKSKSGLKVKDSLLWFGEKWVTWMPMSHDRCQPNFQPWSSRDKGILGYQNWLDHPAPKG